MPTLDLTPMTPEVSTDLDPVTAARVCGYARLLRAISSGRNGRAVKPENGKNGNGKPFKKNEFRDRP